MENKIKEIRKDVMNYLIAHPNIKSLIIGVSGGIDSALVCALVRPICDELGINLIGRSLPFNTNKKEELQRATDIGMQFCTDFWEVKIFNKLELNKIIKIFDESENYSSIRSGNIMARLRMIYLYNLAHTNNGLVLSTDNFTEYLLGFWTLHGDVGDLSPIQNLWKTDVYSMAEYIAKYELGDTIPTAKALWKCIHALPTDGLGITNSDMDQIGADDYFEVDQIFNDYFYYGENKDHPVIKRYLNSEFKRNNPVNIGKPPLINSEDYICYLK